MLLAWELTLLALVRVHAGGGWAGDWLEHYSRLQLFLHHWPRDTVFLGQYTLPARPPLANLAECALLAPLGATFASYQVLSTLIACLSYFPLAALLLRMLRAPQPRHLVLLALLLMCNACFSQNATFSWTKLPTGFLVLTSVLILWDDTGLNPRRQALAWMAMGLAVLCHYSAVAWACGLYVLVPFRLGRGTFTFRGLLALLLPPTLVILISSPWILFCAVNYGPQAMVSSTSTATSLSSDLWGQAATALLNIRDTLVPWILRPVPELVVERYIHHPSALATLHDIAFNAYQCSLPLSLGLSGLLALAAGMRNHRTLLCAPGKGWGGLLLALAITLSLGCAVHTARDHLGLVHICLIPLVLLCLVPIAAWLGNATAPWRIVFIGLAAIDLALGTVMHFLVQAGQGLPLDANRSVVEPALRQHGDTLWNNFATKKNADLIFLGDQMQAWQPALWALAASLLVLTLLLYRSRNSEAKRDVN